MGASKLLTTVQVFLSGVVVTALLIAKRPQTFRELFLPLPQRAASLQRRWLETRHLPKPAGPMSHLVVTLTRSSRGRDFGSGADIPFLSPPQRARLRNPPLPPAPSGFISSLPWVSPTGMHEFPS